MLAAARAPRRPSSVGRAEAATRHAYAGRGAWGEARSHCDVERAEGMTRATLREDRRRFMAERAAVAVALALAD